MDSFALLAFESLAASRTLLQFLACLNFTLDSEDLFCWYKWKKWFLWTMKTMFSLENNGDNWGLTWYLQWGAYTLIPTWIYSRNSLAAAKTLTLNVKTKTNCEDCPNQHKTSHKLCNKTMHLIFSSTESQWKLNHMIRISQWRESHCRINTSARRNK